MLRNGPLTITVDFLKLKLCLSFIYIHKYVCLMSQSWDNVASMHDHVLVHAQMEAVAEATPLQL